MIFMERALELARLGRGLVSPNPMVGAVLVKDGQVIGEGFHLYANLKHAETVAIEMAGEKAQGATLYCCLEPCSHQGRTPPCTDALIRAGISRAVIAIPDPNPRVNGQGIKRLREASIRVDLGLCALEALRLNECYLTFIKTGRAFLHSVICFDRQASAALEDWNPSNQLLDLTDDYDALMLNTTSAISPLFLERALRHKRQRRPILIGSMEAIKQAGAFNLNHQVSDKSLILLTHDNKTLPVESEFSTIAFALAKFDVTGCLVLFDPVDTSLDRDLSRFDKVTFVISTEARARLDASISKCGFDFETTDLNVSPSGGRIEVTGYLRKAEPEAI